MAVGPDRDRQELRDALAGDAHRRAGAAETPSAEELLAYHEGRLGAADEARVGRLLVADPEAARMLLDLAELAEAAPPDAGAGAAPADFAAEAAWRRLAAALPAAAPPEIAPALLTPAARIAGRSATAAAAARAPRWLAAVFGLLATGLALRVVQLETLLRAPEANLARLELPLASRGAAPAWVLPAPGRHLQLLVPADPPCPSYDAEISGAGRDLRVPSLEADSRGLLSVLLRPAPGDYTLVLYGCEPRRELQRQQFQVLAGDPGGG